MITISRFTTPVLQQTDQFGAITQHVTKYLQELIQGLATPITVTPTSNSII